jgi:hypothetical protein
VIDTCTSPYWVLTAGPVNVPDFPAGALVFGALLVGVFVGVLFFAADLDGDALAEGLAGAVIVGVAGDVLATAMPATCVLYENSAARPAAVVPRTTTARRIKPPASD